MIDRNKTELTHNITRQVALWLDSAGFKPVETEVGVADRWIADVAGVGCLTPTELIDLKLIRRKPKWKYGGGNLFNTDVDNSGFDAAMKEWNELYATFPGRLTVTVEVKTSVGDYRGDRKWTVAEWPTNLCYVALPYGMIPQHQWPRGWGVIEFTPEGDRIRKVYAPKVQAVSVEKQLNVVHAIAETRDHKTRYERLRELQKTIRLADGERKTVTRVQNAIALVRDVMKGQSLEDAMRWHQVGKLPECVMTDLRALAPIMADPGDR